MDAEQATAKIWTVLVRVLKDTYQLKSSCPVFRQWLGNHATHKRRQLLTSCLRDIGGEFAKDRPCKYE